MCAVEIIRWSLILGPSSLIELSSMMWHHGSYSGDLSQSLWVPSPDRRSWEASPKKMTFELSLE